MYLGIVGAPITFFLLVLEYTGYRQYLTPLTVGTLCTADGAFLVLAWTNPYHQWYWSNMDYTASVPAGAASTPAPGFWEFVVFTHLLLLAGTVLFVRYALTAPPDDRSTVLETGYSIRDDGTGLGLNIVREIGEAHDWTVHVGESRAKGARFDITGANRTD